MITRLLEPMTSAYQQLSERDQRAMLLLVPSAFAALLLFVVVFPLLNQQKNAKAELEQVQSTYNELLTLAPLAMSDSVAAISVNSDSINALVRREAARSGIAIQRFEPNGETLRVWLEDVTYTSVVPWLGALEQLGIIHTELSLEKRAQGGLVNVRATFSTSNL